jgi:hypothetical protein
MLKITFSNEEIQSLRKYLETLNKKFEEIGLAFARARELCLLLPWQTIIILPKPPPREPHHMHLIQRHIRSARKPRRSQRPPRRTQYVVQKPVYHGG